MVTVNIHQICWHSPWWERVLSYLKECSYVCMYVHDIFQTNTFPVFEWTGAIIWLLSVVSQVLHWVQICQRLVSPSPRWFRNQWHNHLWSSKKRKRKHGTKNTKEREKTQISGRGNEKDQLGDTGSQIYLLSVYLPIHLSVYYIFSTCVPENGGNKKTFYGIAPLVYSLVSVCVTWSAPYVISSRTLINLCDNCPPPLRHLSLHIT